MRRAAALVGLLGTAAGNPNKFEATSPGGDTKCMKGGDYSFMHRKGTVNKLVIEMEGGGGCWNAATCRAGTCTQSVNKDGEVSMLNKQNSGMHDQNPKNAFKEWYHVYIPYCTCDGHTGNNDPKYFGKTMYHRGHVNFMAAMNWTLANFPADPDVVTISGCSAGSVGTIVNWPFVADMYPNAQTYVFGDSYIGLFSAGQYNAAYTNWKLQWPDYPGYAPEYVSKYTENLACYTQEVAGARHPNAVQAWYTSDADVVQTAFFTLGGGVGFTKHMRSLVKCYQTNTSYPHNLKAMHTFIAKGDAHCRSQDDGYYSVTSEGVNLADWVNSMVTGARDGFPRNVDCAADGSCSGDPVGPPDAAQPDLSGYRPPYRQ